MEEVYVRYFIIATAWTAYLALHSAMISITLTDQLKRIMGDHYRWYRLIYNTVAIGTLIPLIVISTRLREPMFFTWGGYLFYPKWALGLLGISLFVAGFRHYSVSQFLGIRQVLEGNRHNLINESGTIDASGILGWIRHPFYAATFVLFWARDLDTTRLIINIIVSVYLVVGTMLEERKLVAEFGEAYEAYRRRVSMFFPWLRIKALIRSAF